MPDVDITAIASAFAGIASAVAAFYAAKVAQDSLEVSRQATAIAKRSVEVSETVGQSQVQIARGQFLLPLWQSFASLGLVNPKDPHAPSVIQAINTLELVALLWEGEMIDRDVLHSAFRDGFLLQYETIAACVWMPSLSKNGAAVVRDSPAARRLYRHLKPET